MSAADRFERLEAPPRPRRTAPDWSVEGADWPHRDHSLFYRVGGHVWHVQRMGEGPIALLLHGTGASTHSWAGLMPCLAERHDVIALDLPGHGFTQAPAGQRPSLENMCKAIGRLIAALEIAPRLIVGHSAGAAIAVRLTQALAVGPEHLVSINGALKPFPGLAGLIAPTMARVLTLGGVAAHVFAQGASDRGRVERLLHQTGAAPPAESVDCYTALLRRPGHVAGTLNMMANWDLSGIEPALKRTDLPVLFLAGASDETVDPGEAKRLAALVPHGTARILEGLGHLAHETNPQAIDTEIAAFCARPPE